MMISPRATAERKRRLIRGGGAGQPPGSIIGPRPQYPGGGVCFATAGTPMPVPPADTIDRGGDLCGIWLFSAHSGTR